MLKQNNMDAASAEVTAEEFAAAAAAVEKRQAEAAQRAAKTVSIGQAVDELGVHASAEDIWQEVQARRAEAETPPLAPPPPLPRALGHALRGAALAAAPGLKQAAQAAAPALRDGVDAVSRHLSAPKQAKRRARPKPRRAIWRGLTAFGVLYAAISFAALTGHLGQLPHVAVPSVSAPYMAASAVGDNHPVVADTATVQRIQAGDTSVKVRDTAEQTNTWRLIRHDGAWYVRGYVRDDVEVGAGPVKMYTDDNAGVLESVPEKDVTLRLDTLKIDSTNNGNDWQEIDVSGVKPDSHTRENW